MIKREIKRWRNRFEKVLEPFAILALVALFVLPALTVLNLTPKVSPVNDNVLGVADRDGVGVALVGGIHTVIDNESIETGANKATYTAKLRAREKGIYSKPILELTNFNNERTEVEVSAYLQNVSDTDIKVVYNDIEYRLIHIDGRRYTQTIPMNKDNKGILYLSLDTKQNIRFAEDLEVTVGW